MVLLLHLRRRRPPQIRPHIREIPPLLLLLTLWRLLRIRNSLHRSLLLGLWLLLRLLLRLRHVGLRRWRSLPIRVRITVDLRRASTATITTTSRSRHGN